jgi:hypothetical protein
MACGSFQDWAMAHGVTEENAERLRSHLLVPG